MKILVFNGSPRMKRGNTEQIVGHFLEGAGEAGADSEIIYIRKLKLSPCNGCLGCWLRTPGVCTIDDDVNALREKLLEADIFVFATPVYLFGSSGYTKLLMERLLFPLTMPEYVIVGGKVYHPIRYPQKKWKALLIANGAFDGDDVFRPLIDMYERMVQNVIDGENRNAFISLGSICVGFGELFADNEIRSKCSPFFEGLRRAGRETAGHGHIAKETLELINRPLYHFAGISREQAIEKNNEMINEYKNKYALLAKIKERPVR